MKNRIAKASVLGIMIVAASITHASDTYRIVNPYESMDPWKSTKGEVKLRKKHLRTTTQQLLGPVTQKFMAVPAKDVRLKSARYQAALIENDSAYERQKRAFSNYMNARYYAQPTFPRIEQLRDRFSNWITSRYR